MSAVSALAARRVGTRRQCLDPRSTVALLVVKGCLGLVVG